MKRLARAALALAAALAAAGPAAPPANAGDDLAFDPRITSLARMLGGVAPDYALHAPLAADRAWQAHRAWLAPRWERLRSGRLQAIESWRDTALAADQSRCGTLFYPFSGPDFLNAYLLFPRCDAYVFVGLEPPGALPELDRMPSAEAAQTLADLRVALGDLLALNYFMTNNMAAQLDTPRLRGVLPVLLASMGAIRVRVVAVGPHELGRAGAAPLRGVAIAFYHPDVGTPQTLYYLAADVSDAGLRAHPELAAYFASLAPATVLVKSASYLLHRPGFSRMREAVLEVADLLVQDDTGVPYRTLRERGWQVQLYGEYTGPIPLFASRRQPDLETAYRSRDPGRALPFAFGYKGTRDGSNAMVARYSGR